ncbi:MAG: thioredoxin domain-containing protein [Opitutus sp.]|nr:thioredoxin domain-containing protein [Opitutus sp.]
MPNALALETSPYLRQHADNPVNWLAWGEAAFTKARAEHKPIFLSIGYSTCHWCHVMAHESFENPVTAKILNEHFVSIKVDREERPDVDKVYMAYVQAMTGHGGWPLSAWLTPELKPFYGGTYYPPEDRPGRPGFPGILQAIAGGWAKDHDKMVAEGERIITTLRQHYGGTRAHDTDAGPDERPLIEAASHALGKGIEYFHEAYDAANGGFGGAPKFPRASNLDFLFRIAALQGGPSDTGAEAIRLAAGTLRAMARGGIHDHIGGGFHRYAVDETWFVPHFEKMLYDQAQIAVNFLDARQASDDERFAWLARDILDYVLRDLRSPADGFYTAEDADSEVPGSATAGKPEHAEGAFYVWTKAEIVAALGHDAEFFCAHFGIEENGNVAARLDPQGEFPGKNILVQRRSLGETAKQAGLTPEAANDALVAGLDKLRTLRNQRPRPQLDDKILTANNGLMISALAKAHQVLGPTAGAQTEPENYLTAARRAAEFIERELYAPDRGVLFRSWREGRGTTEGFAEDYAFLIQGLIDLYEASFELRWLQWAVRLQATMDRLFWDEARGGYFNSAAGDASILLRLREDYDGAEPAPSSVAALNLLRLSVMLETGATASASAEASSTAAAEGYRERGRRCIEAFRYQWAGSPQVMPRLLCALELALDAPRHVVLAGDPQSADFQALAAVVHERLGSRRALLAMPDGGTHETTAATDRQWWVAQAPWMSEMKPLQGRATAYLCEEYACQAPVVAPEELRRLLK